MSLIILFVICFQIEKIADNIDDLLYDLQQVTLNMKARKTRTKILFSLSSQKPQDFSFV